MDENRRNKAELWTHEQTFFFHTACVAQVATVRVFLWPIWLLYKINE